MRQSSTKHCRADVFQRSCMRRLAEQVRKIEETNKQIAYAGCIAAEWLRQRLTPERLQETQVALRQNLLWTEERIREIAGRRAKRGTRLRSRFARNPQLGKSCGEHKELLEAREKALEAQRAILRHSGDALAWLVLRGDPRLIAPLWAPRTHHLASGVGLMGPVMLATTAHDSGKFLVIENDLTRCLGIGDLTVVRADGRWVRPLPLEIKSSGAFSLGAKVEMEVITSISNHPVDAELFTEFLSTLGLRDPDDDDRPSRNAERQSQEILSHSQLLMEVTGRVRERMPLPKDSLWPGMENVLTKALTTGSCFDLIDEGIVAVGIRMRPGDDAERETRRIRDEVQNLRIVAEGQEQVSATSHDLKEDDALSCLVPPIPLWKLSLPTRSALLGGELLYCCIYSPTVWDRAMRQHGVSLLRDRNQWTIEKNGRTAHLDPIEVRKLTLGVLFAGAKPQEVASIMAQALSAPDCRN